MAVPAFLQAAHRRLGPVVLVLALAVVGWTAWRAAQQGARLRDEVRWLRLRLAEKRDQVARLRGEIAEVAGTVERVARTTGRLAEGTTQARRLARMEESRNPTSDIVPVSIGDRGDALVSEDAARVLEQLALIDAQAASASDSVAVITALLAERPVGVRYDRPSMWPVRGAVTSPFGVRADPYGGSRELHPGIDIQAPYGAPVTASADGEVIFAGRDAGYGALVIVSHADGVDTLYGHLSAIYVRESQVVQRGQVLGAVGASGRATGTHLHYEVRVRNAPVDPRRYLGERPAG